jgi:hypothetical protein
MGVGYMMKHAYDVGTNDLKAPSAEPRGGWLAKADDVGDYARLLKLAMNDAGARAAKAVEAEALAAEYKAEAINAKLAGFYQEVLAGTRVAA